MNYRFAVMWMKAFREGPEAVCKLYDDDFEFEDRMLDQRSITDREDLHRVFGPYGNTDPENGIGIHNFTVKDYIGDERCGLIRWVWSADHAAQFFGFPTDGKSVGTEGTTFQVYRDGKIARCMTYWDAPNILAQLGVDLEQTVVPLPPLRFDAVGVS
jgi:steroid delta-isomerase-like uncharacterized protein